MDNSQVWDDPSVPFSVQKESDCRALINILNQVQITKFKLVAGFQEEYQLIEFDKEWKLQTNGLQADDQSQKKNARRRLLKRPQDYQVQTVMNLGKGMMRGQVFMSTFSQQIQRLEHEYNYRIFCEHCNLWIFMREGTVLNSIARVKLMEMKNSLNICTSSKKDLMLSLKSSAKLRAKLVSLGIQTQLRYFSGILFGIFSSVTLKDMFQMKEKIQEVVKYDVAVLNFNHIKSLKLSEAQCMFSVLKDSMAQGVTQIEKFFQVEVECNDHYQCMVIHHKHATFGNEPYSFLKKLFESRVILSVKSRQIKVFDNRVRKSLKQMPFLNEKMNGRRNQTFLCIDTRYFAEAQNRQCKKHLKDLLELFTNIAEKDLELKFYFTHVQNHQDAIKRAIDIAEDNNFNIVNLEDLLQFKHRKMVLRFKDFSQAIIDKRQREILQLVQAMVIKDCKKEVSIVDSFINDNSLISEFTNSFQSQRQHSHTLDDKYKLKWLKITFIMPPIKDYGQEIRLYVKDRRNAAMQKLFNAQSNAKFKIWGLQLSASLKLPKEVEKEPLLIKRPFEGKQLNQRYEICNLQSFGVKEQGAVVFMNVEIKGDFIPVYLFERIA